MKNGGCSGKWSVIGLLAAGVVMSAGPPAGRWTKFTDIPKPVIGMTTVVLGDRIHVLGGSESDAHQVFNPAANSWELKAALPAPEGIGWGMAAPCRGKIYFFGGGYGPQWRGDNKAFVYDPAADRWSPITSMPVKRMQGAAVAVGDAVYVIGGHAGTAKRSREEEIRVTFRYDPGRDLYTRVADMPESGIFLVTAYYKGTVYIVHGVERTVKNPTDAGEGYIWADGVLAYSPARNTWAKLDIPRPQKSTWMITQQSSHAAIGPKLFFGGGGTPPDRRRTDRVFYFDMDRKKFFEVGSLPKVRCCAGGGVVNGRLYIVGGFFDHTGELCAETWGYLQ